MRMIDIVHRPMKRGRIERKVHTMVQMKRIEEMERTMGRVKGTRKRMMLDWKENKKESKPWRNVRWSRVGVPEGGR